jgi:hypothetical protein
MVNHGKVRVKNIYYAFTIRTPRLISLTMVLAIRFLAGETPMIAGAWQVPLIQ